MVIIADLISDAVLEQAYRWRCKRRQRWPPDTDVSRFRQRWPAEKAWLRVELMGGTYTAGLLMRGARQNGVAVIMIVKEMVPDTFSLPGPNSEKVPDTFSLSKYYSDPGFSLSHRG